MKRGGKITLTVIILVAVLALGLWIYFAFFFVFGEGVKAGELNKVERKGWVFKTYEGKLIQVGYNSKGTGNTIQSNELSFSVENKEVAERLMQLTGYQVQLHYKEYRGTLPWRGVSKTVVDSIVSAVPYYGNADPLGFEY